MTSARKNEGDAKHGQSRPRPRRGSPGDPWSDWNIGVHHPRRRPKVTLDEQPSGRPEASPKPKIDRGAEDKSGAARTSKVRAGRKPSAADASARDIESVAPAETLARVERKGEAHPAVATAEDLNPSLIELVGRIRARHELGKSLERETKELARRRIEVARETGLMLIDLKARLGHGRWIAFVNEHCGMNERSARVYKQVAEHWGEVVSLMDSNRQPAADLTLKGILKRLAKPRAKGSHQPDATAAGRPQFADRPGALTHYAIPPTMGTSDSNSEGREAHVEDAKPGQSGSNALEAVGHRETPAALHPSGLRPRSRDGGDGGAEALAAGRSDRKSEPPKRANASKARASPKHSAAVREDLEPKEWWAEEPMDWYLRMVRTILNQIQKERRAPVPDGQKIRALMKDMHTWQEFADHSLDVEYPPGASEVEASGGAPS